MSVAYQSVGYPLPIPIIAVRFRRLVEPIASELYGAIVDTGADMTIAPAEILVNRRCAPATRDSPDWTDGVKVSWIVMIHIMQDETCKNQVTETAISSRGQYSFKLNTAQHSGAPAKRLRRDAYLAPKDPAEVPAFRKTNLQRNRGHGFVGLLQQLLGLVDPIPVEIGDGRHP